MSFEDKVVLLIKPRPSGRRVCPIPAIPFTNNGAEGFNSSLNNEIKNAHPSIVELIMVLRDRDYFNEISIFRPNKLNKLQKEKLERNYNIQKALRITNNETITDVLHKICCLYKFSE